MEKSALRTAYLKQRKHMTAAVVLAKSTTICHAAYDLIDWSPVKQLCVYSSVHPEVDTSSFMERVRESQPSVTISLLGTARDTAFPNAHFDVIIVPVVAFDAQCSRLGRGSGWYDKFLAAQPTAITIGLAFAAQEAPSIPHEAHDIPLDYIVTEQRVFSGNTA